MSLWGSPAPGRPDLEATFAAAQEQALQQREERRDTLRRLSLSLMLPPPQPALLRAEALKLCWGERLYRMQPSCAQRLEML